MYRCVLAHLHFFPEDNFQNVTPSTVIVDFELNFVLLLSVTVILKLIPVCGLFEISN